MEKVVIREIEVSDSYDFMLLKQAIEASSPYMLFEAGERQTTEMKEKKGIEHLLSQENATILVGEKNNQLTSYLVAVGGGANRNRHVAYLVVGVAEAYRGMGVGHLLLQEAERFAQGNKITRLELTVVSENKAAIALYKKAGFQVEGLKKNSLLINGEYVDEYYMAKLI